MPDTDRPVSASRRRFLKRTGWTAVGLTAIAALTYPVARAGMPVLPTFADPQSDDGFAWVQLLSDGRIRFFCPRMEMGQGASLGLSQIVAEELKVPQQQIECILPNTSQIAPVKMTVGSESIFAFQEPVARGAAKLREALRERAARHLGVRPDALTHVETGFVEPDGRKSSFGNLAPQAHEILETSGKEALQLNSAATNAAFRSIGRSWKHTDLAAIVTGQPLYSRDVVLDDMLFGTVLHPPGPGARLNDVDAGAAEALPFVRAVVIDRATQFVGVVTDTPFLLAAAATAVSVSWNHAPLLSNEQISAQFDVSARRSSNRFDHVLLEQGDPENAGSAAPFHITARYETSFLAHCPMEPRAAVVSVSEGRAHVWCGTQDPFFVRGRVARITGLDPEDVTVHPHRLGGGFGGRIQCQPSEEAARLSLAVGKPVRVAWDRETELTQNYFQPIFSHVIEAGASNDGELQSWQHDFVTSPIMLGPMRELLGPSLLARGATGLADRFVADEGSTRGATPPYQVPDRKIRFASVRTGLPTSAWRGLGAAPHAFAIECAMDELAHAADQDPLTFRLMNLPPSQNRLAAVLREAARMATWEKPRPPGRGHGIAAAAYKGMTPVAVVAEVEVDGAKGTITVLHVWCAHDCGLVINPDQVRNLIEGNVIWGCGLALKERITVEDGAISERNFHMYDVLRQHEAPDISISLIEPPGAPPVGVGEAALPPVAPAIANAIFAATGKRLRRLPISFDDLENA